MSSMTETVTNVSVEVFLGVDTHKHTHHAALVDHLGRAIDDRQFPATAAGYRQLLTWARAAGAIAGAGVEGTSSYGVGVSAALAAAGVPVAEVDRPDSRARRGRGKSDPIDAHAAAVAAASGRATTVPKSHDGDGEAIRLLHNTRRSRDFPSAQP